MQICVWTVIIVTKIVRTPISRRGPIACFMAGCNFGAKRKPIPKRRKPATDAGKTVTCRHCRYEYPATEQRCTLCGYPWPWLGTTKT